MAEVSLPVLKTLNDNFLALKSVQSLQRLTSKPHTKKVYRTGAWYIGDFNGTQRNGWGQFKVKNGGLFEGHFINNKRDGEGTYTWEDGTIFQGAFKNDLRDGYGTLTWENGESYSGQFEKDMRHGRGVYTWSDGAKYEGRFEKNMKSGYGLLTKGNGDVFEGMYENDMRSGPGILTYKDSGEQDVGIWKGNTLVKLCTTLPNAFLYNRFQEHFINAEKKTRTKSRSSILPWNTPQCITDNSLCDLPPSFPYEDILNGTRPVSSSKGVLEKLSEKLLATASNGDVAMVEELLEDGLVDPNVSDTTGSSPVLAAAVNCHLDVLNCLLDYGANINQLTNEKLSALSACYLLFYSDDGFLPNIAENMTKENLFNAVEVEKRTGNIINRNDRKSIIKIYETVATYGVTLKRKGQTKYMINSTNLSNNKKRVLGLSNSTTDSSQTNTTRLDSNAKEDDTRQIYYDQWKLEHYQKSIDRVHEVDTINRTFKEFMLKPYLRVYDDIEADRDYFDASKNDEDELSIDENLTERCRPFDLASKSLVTTLASNCGYLGLSTNYDDSLALERLSSSPTVISNIKQKLSLLNAERKPHLLQTIKLLLKRGANPNLSDLPMTALFFAVKSADIEGVQFLLERSADTAAKFKELSLTPLHIAVALPCDQSIQITKLLLQYGANPNARDGFGDGRTPLHIVCCREDDYKQAQKVAAMLLENGANPNLLCCGNSALSLAIASGNDTIIDTLLKFNADTSLPLSHGFGSALCVAASFHAERYRTPEKRLKLIEKLVNHGADLLAPVRVSDKFPPCTVVDYAYHVFTQDRRIACTPYHALTSLEREIFNSRKHMLEVLGEYLRAAVFKKEEELLNDIKLNGIRGSTLELIQIEKDRRVTKKSKRQQQDGGRDELCGLRYVIIKVDINEHNELGIKKKLRYCYECGRSIGVRLSPCTRCKQVFYCSKNCKVKAWSLRHREECTKFSGDKHTSRRSGSPTLTSNAMEKQDQRLNNTPGNLQQQIISIKPQNYRPVETVSYNRSFFPQL